MDSVITATKARQNFFKLVEKTDHPGASVVITMDGKPKVVMMSLEEFEGWQETLEIMVDRKTLKVIEESLKSKKTYSEDIVKKKLGL